MKDMDRILLEEVAAAPRIDTASLWNALEERLGRGVNIMVYKAALDRLERDGFVEKDDGEIVPERGMRPRIHVSLTAAGLDALATVITTVSWGHE